MAGPTRREFLRMASSVSMGFVGLQRYCRAADPEYQQQTVDAESWGYGPLVADPDGVLDLPAGFSYKIISRAGEVMHDGLFVPGKHDGMAAFPAGAGRVILVRNHECELEPATGAFGANYEKLDRVPKGRIYDWPLTNQPPLGGTTTLLYDTGQQQLERHFLSLAGTLRNCAGGPTPWNSWITCEETVDTAGKRLAVDHGYNFEVPAILSSGLVEPIPLTEMGRFRHEAIAVDPCSGVVFETEDMDDGLLYRFLPNQPGKMHRGGRLQALALRGQASRDTRNWPDLPDPIASRVLLETEWIDLDDVRSPQDDLRYRGFDAGAARFARAEGMWYGRDSVFFACTTGGKARLGQIWRYFPSPREGQSGERDQPGRLELFIESENDGLIENADNLTVAPWGDLYVCEDGKPSQFVVGITPEGKCFRFARNAMNESEFAGATFAPDGSTLFVNIQTPGLTLAISGPWRKT